MKKLCGIIAVLAALAGLPSVGYAAFGLEDTGLGDWKVAGPDGAAPSPLFTLPGSSAVDVANSNWTAPVWPVPVPGTSWVSANANGGSSIDGGFYTYALEFNIPSWVNLSSVTITGLWSSDNNSSFYLQNDTSANLIGTLPYGTPGNYSHQVAKAFSIVASDGLVAGLNTLYFIVTNGNGGGDTNGPSALAVHFSDVAFTATPEPTTLVVWSGLAAIGGVVAYRRRVAA